MPLLSNKYISEDDLETIQLPVVGEWVRVKRRLSRGDEVALQTQLLEFAVFGSDSELPVVPDEKRGPAFEAMEFSMLEKAIVGWSFDAQVDAENIRALDPDSVAAIKDKLSELYPSARTDDDRKNSLAPGGAPLEARESLLVSSNGSAS